MLVDEDGEIGQSDGMEISNCPVCGQVLDSTPTVYCPQCGYCLALHQRAIAVGETPQVLVPTDEIPQRVGRYQVVREIARGGMGDVLLVWDPVARREVALKRIRRQLQGRDLVYHRFLREAWITSRLAHPSAISIYDIHAENGEVYYTMPYVKGRTLSALLREARRNEKNPSRGSSANSSIPNLIRVFVSLCQVVAYAHSRAILHRDLKPSNVMVGDYGEVYVLDWGLAKPREEVVEAEQGEDEEETDPGLTRPGKLVGTLSYLAPERVLGHPATELSDIFALGVILYQILCLRQPFQRDSIKAFRKNLSKEVFIDPASRAPYRNVPHMLARIAKRCLAYRMEDRYQSVTELIRDLESYLQGRSDWFEIGNLNLDEKKDWEFQENIYLARDVALTGTGEVTAWVTLMVSKQSFPGNLRLTTKVRLGVESAGMGLLLSIPEPAERELPAIGYCLWLGSNPRAGSKLIRSSVDVLDLVDVYLRPEQEYELRIEKVENNLHFYLDDELKFSYISYLPLSGTHVGVMVRDADFFLSAIKVEVGSYSIKVNCLAVPDAFLANKDYDRALAEYRRIGYSFPQRDEGREGMFRAGITLLEQAKSLGSGAEAEATFEAALNEFDTLHNTAGAPLEYLGKSLVYAALDDNEEEIKCFQLTFRRYPHHPLVSALEEQVLYRMHEAARKDRWAAYRFVLLCAQLLPNAWERRPTVRLVEQLQRHWEPLPFMLPLTPDERRQAIRRTAMATTLSFWLAQPLTLFEMAEQLTQQAISPICLSNALYALCELGSSQLAESFILESDQPRVQNLKPLIILQQQSLAAAVAAAEAQAPDDRQGRVIAALMEAAIRQQQPAAAHQLRSLTPPMRFLSPREHTRLDALQIWAYLLEGNWQLARKEFDHFPLEWINLESSLLHPLYGCLLAATEGEELARIHLGGVLEVPFPRSWSLLGHYLTQPPDQQELWLTRAFMWEKRQLYQQLSLYYHCLKDLTRSAQFADLADACYTTD